MNNTMFRMGTPKEKFRKVAIWVLKGGLLATTCGYIIWNVYTEFSWIMERNYEALWKLTGYSHRGSMEDKLAAFPIVLCAMIFFPDKNNHKQDQGAA